MMHYYKRIPPKQIVRLREGAELAVVICPLPKSAANEKHIVHAAITKEINAVIMASCIGVHHADRVSQLQTILRTHEIERDGGDCHEIQMRLQKRPEREHINTTEVP